MTAVLRSRLQIIFGDVSGFEQTSRASGTRALNTSGVMFNNCAVKPARVNYGIGYGYGNGTTELV